MSYTRNLILILLILCNLSCEQGDQSGIPTLEILKPTEISETSFQLNWTVSDHNFQTLAIDLFLDKDMEVLHRHIEISDVAQQYQQFIDMRGATKYYYQISVIRDDEILLSSDRYGVETSYEIHSVTLVTSDGKNLTASLANLESNTGPQPGIILMHELGVFVNPWLDSYLLKLLVSDGYVCLSFFNRGHGTSSPIEGDLMSLIEDKSLIVKDLEAAISYMKNQSSVAPDSLGLIGASMGGIMALAGNGYDEVLTSVSLSAPAEGVYYIFPDMTLTSTFYLAGELDIRPANNMDAPGDASLLFNATRAPRKLIIIPGTSDHGSSLLTRDSLNIAIQEWVRETLARN